MAGRLDASRTVWRVKQVTTRNRPTLSLLAAGALLLVPAVAGCGSGGDDGGVLGTVYKDVDPPHDVSHPAPLDRVEGPLKVRRGERFSIAMRTNPSARLDWSLSGSGSDPRIVRSEGTSSHQTAREKELIGGGYTTYFTFEGVGPGSTTVVLANDCGTDPGRGCYSATLPRTVTYRVTVR